MTFNRIVQGSGLYYGDPVQCDEPASLLLDHIRAERAAQGTNGKTPKVTKAASPANN